MKRIIAAFCLALLFSTASEAQNSTAGVKTIGFSVIGNDFTTAQRIRSSSLGAVLRQKQTARFKDMDLGAAVTYTNGINSNIDFAATLGGSFSKSVVASRTAESFLLEVDAAAHFKMFPNLTTVNPYIIAGIGASKYTNIYGAFIPVGGGIKFNLFDETFVTTQLQYRIPVTTEANNYHFQLSFGISGLIGEKKAEPPVVVEPPKPLDTDGDGVFDADDKCVTVFGLAKYQGCPIPDTDKDGINDEQDKCPQVAGVAKYQGCPVPDTDKDGINDDEDKCPQVAGVARYQGCPVPDTDSDGVNDEEDRCPTVAGVASNGGCPEVKEEVIAKVNYAAKRIFFVTGSAKLSTKSNTALNEVVKILSDDANLKLDIGGHTDNVGKADFNQTLSEKRAAAVKEYLVKKGVDESRLTSAGYGMDKPIASNKTAKGKAQNRRVELKLAY